MKDFFKKNSSYFATLLLLLVVAAYFLLQINKGDESIYFSQHRSDFANFFFRFCTHIGEPYVYIAAAGLLALVQYRHAISIFVLSALVLVFAESLKRLFAHPRPLTYFEEVLHQPQSISLVLSREEMNISWTSSFPSGHTTSAFAFYGFLALIAPNHFLRVLCVITATLVGLSRVYLIQHFLEDITAGAITGTVVALITYAIHQWMGVKYPWTLNALKRS